MPHCLRRMPLLLLCLGLAACRVGQNPRPVTLNADSAARVDITAALESYRRARLAGDARAVAALFTADGRLAQPGAEDLVGPRQVQEALRPNPGGGTVIHAVVETEELHVDGPVAFEAGTFEETLRTGDGAEETVRGRYTIEWRRGPEARWRIRRFLLNHLPPAETETDADVDTEVEGASGA